MRRKRREDLVFGITVLVVAVGATALTTGLAGVYGEPKNAGIYVGKCHIELYGTPGVRCGDNNN